MEHDDFPARIAKRLEKVEGVGETIEHSGVSGLHHLKNSDGLPGPVANDVALALADTYYELHPAVKDHIPSCRVLSGRWQILISAQWKDYCSVAYYFSPIRALPEDTFWFIKSPGTAEIMEHSKSPGTAEICGTTVKKTTDIVEQAEHLKNGGRVRTASNNIYGYENGGFHVFAANGVHVRKTVYVPIGVELELLPKTERRKGDDLRAWLVVNSPKVVDIINTAPRLEVYWDKYKFSFMCVGGEPCAILDTWVGTPQDGTW